MQDIRLPCGTYILLGQLQRAQTRSPSILAAVRNIPKGTSIQDLEWTKTGLILRNIPKRSGFGTYQEERFQFKGNTTLGFNSGVGIDKTRR